MKISTKGRYALEAVTDLALHSDGQTESIRAIAGRRGLSDNYLEQIFLQLRKAGLLESTRGPQGGYRLAGSPEALTAWQVLAAVEDRLSPVHCPPPGEKGDCGRGDCCATRFVWDQMLREIEQTLQQIRISDLVAAVGREKNLPSNDYCI